jgi:2-succinyl-5-enolpyruvyl-6-hydroxy-3-cyclohexene-1-carboxylate synthase
MFIRMSNTTMFSILCDLLSEIQNHRAQRRMSLKTDMAQDNLSRKGILISGRPRLLH